MEQFPNSLLSQKIVLGNSLWKCYFRFISIKSCDNFMMFAENLIFKKLLIYPFPYLLTKTSCCLGSPVLSSTSTK
jgi:hypothetical protein